MGGTGCNVATGRFLVAEAVYKPDNTIQRFHAKFEQHCDGWSPALRGEIWIDSAGSTAIPPMADLTVVVRQNRPDWPWRRLG